MLYFSRQITWFFYNYGTVAIIIFLIRTYFYQYNQLGQFLTADAKDSLLKQYKNDPEVVGFLTSGRWEGISDAKLKKLVNDPAVQQAFKTQAATYAFDNRANMEYDPKTGTNIFTRQLSAKDQQQFSSGVSKYLYGVLKQKLFTRDTNDFNQDLS